MKNLMKEINKNSYQEGNLLISETDFDSLDGVLVVNNKGERLLVLNCEASEQRKSHIINIAKGTKEDMMLFKKEDGSVRRQA